MVKASTLVRRTGAALLLWLCFRSSSFSKPGHVLKQTKKPPSHAEEAPVSPPTPTSTNVRNGTAKSVCDGYKGILLIKEGDEHAAAGTLFFTYVINQILYAKRENLLPLIHLQPKGQCYDSLVHGAPKPNMPIEVQSSGAQISSVFLREHDQVCGNPRRPKAFPGTIRYDLDSQQTANKTLEGNGIWESYFEAPILSVASYQSQWQCQLLPWIELPKILVTPGIHHCAPWAVRPWWHENLPLYTKPDYNHSTNQSSDSATLYSDWYYDMRKRAHSIIHHWIRPLPWLVQEAKKANPAAGHCLAMHIRHTDKGHGRIKIPLEAFQPYAELYAEMFPSNHKIYVATDDNQALSGIAQNWPDTVSQRIIFRNNTLRNSGGNEGVFWLFGDQHHRTNSEGLAEIYAMASCNYLVHGFSAMAEAAVYVNFGELGNQSMNLEEIMEPSINKFKTMLEKRTS